MWTICYPWNVKHYIIFYGKKKTKNNNNNKKKKKKKKKNPLHCRLCFPAFLEYECLWSGFILSPYLEELRFYKDFICYISKSSKSRFPAIKNSDDK